jgi:predicted DNA-binding transcriptional regulator YafY
VIPDRCIRIDYTNWRGERRERIIEPSEVWFGATPHHPEPQWFLRALDVEKGEDRDFALRDIHTSRKVEDGT